MSAAISSSPTAPVGLALRHGFAVITPADILWVEAAGTGTRVHLASGEILDAMLGLSELEKRLPPLKFCRIHAGYLVNLQQVSDWACEPGPGLWMQGGSLLSLPEGLPEATTRRISAAIEHNRMCWG